MKTLAPEIRTRRSTQQRQVVRHIIESSRDHPTAQAVHERARQKMPSISLGTVYRNLQFLVDQGLLLERKIGNRPARYEAQRQRHYHVCCVECGALEDLPVPYQDALDRRVQKAVRYKLREHRMEFYGVCPQCQADARQQVRPAATARIRKPG
jgi:Fe2+ or Zn2+ uptake regulation protein